LWSLGRARRWNGYTRPDEKYKFELFKADTVLAGMGGQFSSK
jgi:hypothetical protein